MFVTCTINPEVVVDKILSTKFFVMELSFFLLVLGCFGILGVLFVCTTFFAWGIDHGRLEGKKESDARG